MQGNQSEVARLKAQLNAECEAARLAMYGYAEVARHEVITAKMERMGALHEQLKGIGQGRERELSTRPNSLRTVLIFIMI